MNQRVCAAKIVFSVVYQKRSLASAELSEPLLQQLVYGSLRFWYQLDFIAQKLLQKPLRRKDGDVYSLLIVGLYQLLALRVAEHAVLMETVNAVKAMKKNWAAGLINAVLRRFIAKQDELLQQCQADLSAQYAHPQWLIQRIQADWPQQWQSILLANNTQAPMFLRVNTQKISRLDYLALLKENQIDAQVCDEASSALRLTKPLPVTQLPEFSKGYCSVQDVAGQSVLDWLQLKPGLTVLDACSAPGSKTCHMLEAEPGLAKVLALDSDGKRLKKLTENLTRLQLTDSPCQWLVADASQPDQWWDGQQFDRILLDAPCSATGVIRRHPDIKLLREQSDVKQLVILQQQLLQSLWPVLKPGGLLVYTTCSVLLAENQQQVERFAQNERTAQLVNAKTLQRLPTVGGCDGFFYASLLRNA